ncbi:MAG: fumarylacetoacetate hydrolase family protein [bacterium]
MILATRKNGTRDGELIVVSRDLKRGIAVPDVAPTLQALLDDWDALAPRAKAAFEALQAGQRDDDFAVDQTRLHSPLPRAYAWIDGSAYINHIVLVRKARGAEPPATLETDPLVYQGGSDTFLDPRGPIPVADEAYGIDFEGEVAVITGDVPAGTSAKQAEPHIKLVMLVNDVSLRNLIPAELAKGFGFYVSKPSSAFSPFALTPDELGSAWREGRVHLPLRSWLNGERFGDPDAGPEMHFSFHQLLEHAAKTRDLAAGTIIGSGTVSNVDQARGSSCLAEKRMLEKIEQGTITTPFMQFGDTIRIQMLDAQGRDLFGVIEQTVVPREKR